MNSVKSLLLALLLVFSTAAFADEVPFSVSSVLADPAKEGPEVVEANLVAQLKLQAVTDYLQGYLGTRFPQFEKHLNTAFAERYVLNYSISRTATQPVNLVVSGQLDADALKGWVRLADAKKGGNQPKVVLFMSSNLPNAAFSAGDTAKKIREVPIANALFTVIAPHFQQLNTKVNAAEGGPSRPPKSADARSLSSFFDGSNSAVWIDVLNCPSCGGARVDIFGYNQERLLFALSDDVAIQPRDLQNTDALKALLASTGQQFRQEWESVVSRGKLVSQQYRLVIEGLESYRNYKGIEGVLQRQDYLQEMTMREASAKSATYDFVSSMALEEIVERLAMIQLANRPLHASKTDSRTVTVK